MSRIAYAFRSFFSILFSGELPADIAAAFGYTRATKAAAPAPPAPKAPEWSPSDGALQMLGILQRDARLVDFLMEDISAYDDEQVGAAVRSMHEQCRAALQRYVELAPVIDGVEGAYARLDASLAKDAAMVKLIGNVPADGKVAGGTLRHKGWRAQEVKLPALAREQKPAVLAPAEIEIE